MLPSKSNNIVITYENMYSNAYEMVYYNFPSDKYRVEAGVYSNGSNDEYANVSRKVFNERNEIVLEKTVKIKIAFFFKLINSLNLDTSTINRNIDTVSRIYQIICHEENRKKLLELQCLVGSATWLLNEFFTNQRRIKEYLENMN